MVLSKHDILSQCWVGAGPSSATLAQNQAGNGSPTVSAVYWNAVIHNFVVLGGIGVLAPLS